MSKAMSNEKTPSAEEQLIFGKTWAEIQALQQGKPLRRPIATAKHGDHGADPIGDGTFRMVPSGDVVDLTERDRRLSSSNTNPKD